MTKRAPQKPKIPAPKPKGATKNAACPPNKTKINYTSPNHGGRRNPPPLRADWEKEPPHWTDRVLDAIPGPVAAVLILALIAVIFLVGAMPNS